MARLKKPTAETIRKVIILADKNAKNNLIHKNKAARLKSRLSKLVKSAHKTKPAAKLQKNKTSKAKK